MGKNFSPQELKPHLLKSIPGSRDLAETGHCDNSMGKRAMTNHENSSHHGSIPQNLEYIVSMSPEETRCPSTVKPHLRVSAAENKQLNQHGSVIKIR